LTIVAIGDVASNASVINERVSIITDVARVSLIAGEAVTDAAEETAVTKSTDSQISTAGLTII